MPIQHKRPAFALFVRASVANKQNQTAQVRGLGDQSVFEVSELELSRCVHYNCLFRIDGHWHHAFVRKGRQSRLSLRLNSPG